MELGILVLTAGACILLGAFKRLVEWDNVQLVVTGDEDMKIASPGSFGKAKRTEDVSELEAQRYLELKNNGSIDKARELGQIYASILLSKNQEETTGNGDDPLCRHQQMVLCSYVINRVISELSPNSMLAQTSLNVFYDDIEEASPELYRHVSDMAAFSLYILCERSNARSEDEIGQVYAQLCGCDGDKAYVEEGNTLYHDFYTVCAEQFRNIGFPEV